MDIIDIMLARAMTPQGQTDLYVSKANKAAAKAAQAEADAQAAIDVVTNAAETIADTQAAAADLLETAQEVLETAQEAQINTLDTEDVDAEVRKLQVAVNLVNGNSANTYQVVTTYPDNTLHTENATKMYKATGTNEDGTMTQKAITAALDSKADSATTASKEYVDNAIAAIPSGSGSGSGTNVNIDDGEPGQVVVIGDDGNLAAGDVTEAEIIDTLLRTGTYNLANTVGLEMNYSEKYCLRLQEAKDYTMGTDFNRYSMYGGRRRCNVSDNGSITAFYGENNYKDDGSNGQVMVYQPKFYYKRIILKSEPAITGQIVHHELLFISPVPQVGFKLAPAFSGDLEYILLPAYDGSLVDNKLASIAGQLPVNNLSIIEAENYATARGTGWHIMNIAAEATNQMLEMIEFGSLNGQQSIESGIITTPNGTNGQCYFITGSTASLGNNTGHATSTQVNFNDTITEYTDEGYRAISYRGMENPWGNFWSMIGGLNVAGSNNVAGGMPYICTDFNYTPDMISNNYEDVGFNLPNEHGWISAMGYGKEKYDWLYMPAACSSSANSLLPIGDGIWTVPNLTSVMTVAIGGSFGFNMECGPFYYAADRALNKTSRWNYGAKLLFIPTKNTIYTTNINKWKNYTGG